jgi:hypothetical protein
MLSLRLCIAQTLDAALDLSTHEVSVQSDRSRLLLGCQRCTPRLLLLDALLFTHRLLDLGS